MGKTGGLTPQERLSAWGRKLTLSFRRADFVERCSTPRKGIIPLTLVFFLARKGRNGEKYENFVTLLNSDR